MVLVAGLQAELLRSAKVGYGWGQDYNKVEALCCLLGAPRHWVKRK
jgi:hypothetical protein